MNAASPSPSPMAPQLGSVTIADGLAAYGLTPLSEAHIGAIEGRGLDPELLVTRGVGASSKLSGDAIGIPFVSDGKIVALKHRTLGADKQFTQDKGGKQVFYNIDCLRDQTLKGLSIIVTEGELDALAAIQAGFVRTVSVPGGAPSTAAKDGGRTYAYLDEALGLFDGTIILATDNDDPGRILRDDLALRLGRHRCKWIRYPKGCKDLNDALRTYGILGVTKSLATAMAMPIPGGYRLSELPELPPCPAYDTGIIGLKAHYNLRLGDLTVVTGVPGHGKTSFINEVCCRMAQNYGWKTVFASFEQTPQRDHRRALRSFWSEKLEVTMDPEEKHRADQWIEKHFTFVVPSEDDEVDLKWLLELFSSMVQREEAKIVVIDPWNEMDHDRPPDMTMTEYVGFAIKRLKRFARKYNVHMIVAAHPAKMQRGKDGSWPVPSLYDISDSAHWTNKPDAGIIVHRKDLGVNETIIRVVKARYHDIGVPGQILGSWSVERTRYTITNDGGGMGLK